MSQNFIGIFKQSCIKLAHTVVINHPYAGTVINQELKLKGYGSHTNDQDLSTWKYYMNMAGLYHAYDLAAIKAINTAKGLGTTPGIDQTKMIFQVASDEGTIEKEFTIENISGVNSDEIVSSEFQVGEASYNALLETYPAFESLIKGILHPIPLSVSINADEFDILYCGGYYKTRLDRKESTYAYIKGTGLIYGSINLIEDWEYDLVDELNSFTKKFFKQHDNRVYGLYNNLYFASSIGIYYLNLPMAIFNIRLNKVKTYQVHSTHVQLYLDSYSKLGQYISYLSREQYMYLYRNTDWLATNAGKKKVLDDLITNLLKPRKVAVIYYNGILDTELLPDNSVPTPLFVREYEDATKLINNKKIWTPNEIIVLEQDLAKYNKDYVNDQTTKVSEALQFSPESKVKTKVIETHLTNQTRIDYISKEEFLFNNWAWGVYSGEYTGIIQVTIPNTGKSLQLTIKNALMLFYYCYGKGMLNIQPESLPKMMLHQIPKTLSEIGDISFLTKRRSTRFLTDAEITNLYNLTPTSRVVKSTGQFSRYIETQWTNLNIRNYIGYENPYIEANGQIKGMIQALYHCKEVQFVVEDDYDSWVNTLGYNISTMSKSDLTNLANAIFRKALNINAEDEETLTRVHKALINIVKVFTSYNIQFITNTASGEVANVGVNYLRMESLGTIYFGGNDYFIRNYPECRNVSGLDKSSEVKWGFSKAFDTYENGAVHLSQEQLKELILSEAQEGLLLGGYNG